MKIPIILRKIIKYMPIFVATMITVVTIKNLVSNESWLGYDKGTQSLGLFFGLLLLTVLSWFLSSIFSKIEIRFYLLGWIVVFIYQTYMIFQLHSEVGWDAGMVINAAFGNMPEEAGAYLSIYPNNLFLVYIYRCIFRIFSVSFENRFLAGALLNLVFMNVTLALLYSLSKRFLGERGRLFTLFYFVLLIGSSPWIIIPYSDLASMPFVTGIVLFYFKIIENSKEQFPGYLTLLISLGLGILLFTGFKIKPTVVIAFIAVCIIYALFHYHKKSVLVILAGGFFTFVLFAFLWNCFAKYQKDFIIDENRSVSYSHYLMLGLNDNYGCYTEEDIAITLSAETKKEKQEKNFEVIRERLQNMGIAGLAVRQWKKLCRIHSEGNFFFGGEGGMNFLNFDLSRQSFLRNVFYINGKYYACYKYFVQGIWLALCLFIGLNVFEVRKGGKEVKAEHAMIFLIILGIILFNLLFEARSRYLISFLPFYVMAAARGAEMAGIWISQKHLHSSLCYDKLFTL